MLSRFVATPFLALLFSTCVTMLSGCESSTVNTEPNEPSQHADEEMVYRPDANLAYNDPAVKQTFLDGVRLLYEERYEEARARLRPLAEAGHTDAQFFMARSYTPHDLFNPSSATPYDWEQGIPWLRRSADGGNARAQWELGAWYYHGSSGRVRRSYFQTDWDKVRHYLRAAAEQGLAIAQSTLAVLYDSSHGVEMNDAAFNAHAEQYFPVAWMYYTLASQRYPAHAGNRARVGLRP